jgi:hypothetical protein
MGIGRVLSEGMVTRLKNFLDHFDTISGEKLIIPWMLHFSTANHRYFRPPYTAGNWNLIRASLGCLGHRSNLEV